MTRPFIHELCLKSWYVLLFRQCSTLNDLIVLYQLLSNLMYFAIYIYKPTSEKAINTCNDKQENLYKTDIFRFLSVFIIQKETCC